MYDVSQILTEFKSLVGWIDSANPEIPKLGSGLTTSDSGKYVNQGHPLVTVDNIFHTAPDFDNYTASAYAAGTTYAAGDICRYNNVVYISLKAANTGHTPIIGEWWTTLLSNHVDKLTDAAITKVIDQVLLRKKLNRSTKGLLQNLLIFDGAGDSRSLIIQEGRFVGMEITLTPFDSIRAKVSQIGVQFSAANKDKKIYLFHESQPEAISTHTFTARGGQYFDWSDTELEMKVADLNDAGGRFYLGYFEDDMAGQAVRKTYNFTVSPCAGCITQNYNRHAYEQWTKYVTIRPFSIAHSYLNGASLPDLSGVQYEDDNNFGLNLALSVNCDYTDLLIANKSIFRTAIMYQGTYEVLMQIAYSTRMDYISQATKDRAMLELKGDQEAKIQSFEKTLAREIEGLELDFSGFNSPCLASRGSGITWESI